MANERSTNGTSETHEAWAANDGAAASEARAFGDGAPSTARGSDASDWVTPRELESGRLPTRRAVPRHDEDDGWSSYDTGVWWAYGGDD